MRVVLDDGDPLDGRPDPGRRPDRRAGAASRVEVAARLEAGVSIAAWRMAVEAAAYVAGMR
ncbi:hypothetical protein ACFQ0B_40900 [Nonomuraea thailandensis]